MKLLIFFIFALQSYVCDDFFMYHCKYISSKSLVQKVAFFDIKGKFTPSNHSTIIYFGNSSGFDSFKKLARNFDIKPVMISGQLQINTNHFNSGTTFLEYSDKKQSQLQNSIFKGLSGTNIKVQLGQQTVKQFQDLYQVSNTGLYLNLLPIKVGDHFEVEVSIRSTTLNEKTLFSSQTILVNNDTWTSLNTFNSSQRSKTKKFNGNLKNLLNKTSDHLNLNARILLNAK